MSQYNFGIGTLIAKRTDVTYPKPAFMGVIQDVEVNFDRELKTLVGQYNVAEAIAGGELKITAKAKFARIQANLLGDVYLNTTPATGQTIMAQGEVKPIVANAITVAEAATFVEDLGVFDSSGVQLTPVASAPAVGQYSVSAGVYTFNAGQTAGNYTIYYDYTKTTGYTNTLAKQLMGSLPTFALFLESDFSQFGVSKKLFLKLNAVVCGKLAMPFKNKDFTIQDLDMQAFCDASGNWGSISTTE